MTLSRKQKILVLSAALCLCLFIQFNCFPTHTSPGRLEKGGLISDFENDKIWDTSPETGFDLKLSRDHVTQGRHSLEVVYPIGGLPSVNTRKLAHDLGDYEYFAFDVFNPQSETLRFTVRLDDDSGRRVNIPYSLSPGQNTVRIARTQIAGGINAAKIHFIVLFLNEPQKRYKLFFDNLRLERSGTFNKEATMALAQQKYAKMKPLPVRKAILSPPTPVTKSGMLRIPVAKISSASILTPGRVDNTEAIAETTPLQVSTGVPFAPGQLSSPDNLAFFDKNGSEIPVALKVLARWPQDQSIRAVLVQFQIPIAHLFEYVTMRWGVSRTPTDLKIIEPTGEYPQAFMVLPKTWLCTSEVIGEQVPVGQDIFSAYDERFETRFPEIQSKPWSGDLSEDGFYSIAHVFYQFYVRTGDIKYFLAARRELLHYRDTQVILHGDEKGRAINSSSPMYVYIDALMDDYLLTGDPRSLEVAGDMAAYLKKNFNPAAAYYPKTANHFWTERNQAFAFLGILLYYELTLDESYKKIADAFMTNLYKTQMEWPSRGGFIHNLYAHDPDEGARPDEYGGSPFMTGLLLEPIIEYHRMTHSDTAADSIFRALDWLINEGLVKSQDSFKYMTADKYFDSDGTPDLDMLIVHAFGYGYKISGYQRADYWEIGQKVFAKALKDAYISRRKHFCQSHRSSAHYLAYVSPGVRNDRVITADANIPAHQDASLHKTSPDPDALVTESFDESWGRFVSSGDALLQVEQDPMHSHGNVLKIQSRHESSHLSLRLPIDRWNVQEFSGLSFHYRVPSGTPVGIRVKTEFEDWICLGGTRTYRCAGTESTEGQVLIDDDNWHELKLNVGDALHAVLGKVKYLAEFQFYTGGNAKKDDVFWIDEFRVRK